MALHEEQNASDEVLWCLITLCALPVKEKGSPGVLRQYVI